ncbi:MAG: Xaa-Pro aminopeptidase, partial [Cyclobacteriaceae bacterium]
MNKLLTTLTLLLLFNLVCEAQYPTVLTQREQAKVIDELLNDRLRNLLPGLMKREGFDMWIVMSREYNEDPVIKTLLPA